YCLTVPNHIILVKSNGKTLYSMNSREDDFFRDCIIKHITGIPQFTGQGFFDLQNKNFCGIHLYHPAACRDQSANQLNKSYYDKIAKPVKNVKSNEGWPYGKMLKYSYVIIN